MKEVSFYKEKANALLHKANEVWREKNELTMDNPFFIKDIEEFNEITIEFLHLVHRYDPTLPLNEYISSLKNVRYNLTHSGFDANCATLNKYIEFFIKYLEEYED